MRWHSMHLGRLGTAAATILWVGLWHPVRACLYVVVSCLQFSRPAHRQNVVVCQEDHHHKNIRRSFLLFPCACPIIIILFLFLFSWLFFSITLGICSRQEIKTVESGNYYWRHRQKAVSWGPSSSSTVFFSPLGLSSYHVIMSGRICVFILFLYKRRRRRCSRINP